MAIYGVNVAFNVEADSQEHAFRKMLNHVKKNLTDDYEEITQPVLQPGLTAEDCETLIK